jgi:hypothetical protein
MQADEISTLKTRLDAMSEEKIRDDLRREREQPKPRQVAVRKPARVVSGPEEILNDEPLEAVDTADPDEPEPRLKDVPDLGRKPERQWDEKPEPIPEPPANAPKVDKRPRKSPATKVRQKPAPPQMSRRLKPVVEPFAK